MIRLLTITSLGTWFNFSADIRIFGPEKMCLQNLKNEDKGMK